MKRPSRLIFVILGTLLLSGCGGKKKSGPSDYGGGNVKAEKIPIEQVKNEILRVEGAKLNIFYGIESMANNITNNKDDLDEQVEDSLKDKSTPQTWTKEQIETIIKHLDPALKKIVSEVNSKTIYNILRETRIYVEDKKPCYSQSGEAKDASIYGPDGKICISALRLSSSDKLNNLNLTKAIIGLVVHEYSHKMGTTEEEAEALQLFSYLFFTDKTIESVYDDKIPYSLTDNRDRLQAIKVEIANLQTYNDYKKSGRALPSGDSMLEFEEESAKYNELPELENFYAKIIERAYNSPRVIDKDSKNICRKIDSFSFEIAYVYGYQSSVWLFQHYTAYKAYAANLQKLQIFFCESMTFEIFSEKDGFTKEILHKEDLPTYFPDSNLDAFVNADFEIYRTRPRHKDQLEKAIDLMIDAVDELIESRKKDISFTKSIR